MPECSGRNACRWPRSAFATAAAIGDEHAIKLAEVAVRHHALAPDPRYAAAAHVANRGLGRFHG